MLTISLVLALAALLVAIYSVTKPANVLWVAVVLLAILELLRTVPVGR